MDHSTGCRHDVPCGTFECRSPVQLVVSVVCGSNYDDMDSCSKLEVATTTTGVSAANLPFRKRKLARCISIRLEKNNDDDDHVDVVGVGAASAAVQMSSFGSICLFSAKQTGRLFVCRPLRKAKHTGPTCCAPPNCPQMSTGAEQTMSVYMGIGKQVAVLLIGQMDCTGTLGQR